MRITLSRRDLLEKCAGAGLLLLAPRMSAFDLAPHLEEGALAPRRPTPPNELGPFYKKRAPRSARYGEVAKVIDAVTGAGAQPVGLQTDELPN